MCRVWDLPTVLLSKKALPHLKEFEQINKLHPDSFVKLSTTGIKWAPWQKKNPGKGATLQDRSQYIRENYLPSKPSVRQAEAAKKRQVEASKKVESKRHFDALDQEADLVERKWRDNPLRFLLIGKPQVGKV